MSCFLLINLCISSRMLLPALYMRLPFPRRWFAKYNTGYMVGKTIRGIKPRSKLLLPCTFLALAHLWTCLQQQAALLHKHEVCWDTSLKLSDRCIWRFWVIMLKQGLYTALCLLGERAIKDCAVGWVLAALLLGIQPWYSFVSILHRGYHTASARGRSKNIFKSAKEEVKLR